MKKLNVLGVEFTVSDTILYADDGVYKEYIDAIKKGKGLAKKVLK